MTSISGRGGQGDGRSKPDRSYTANNTIEILTGSLIDQTVHVAFEDRAEFSQRRPP